MLQWGTGFVQPLPTPGLCKAAQAASAALGRLSPQTCVGCSVLWVFRAPGAVLPCTGQMMQLCPCSLPPCDTAPSSSLGPGLRRAPGQSPREELPWLVELPTVSLKACRLVGKGGESRARHTRCFRSASCHCHPGPSPCGLGSAASAPVSPEVNCQSKETGEKGWETFLR